MSSSEQLRSLRRGLLRTALLVVIIAASGAAIGLAVGYPLGRLQFAQSDAVRLDQARLAGTVDPAKAITEQSDLSLGWTPGNAALAGFGILGNDLCGESVELPTALSAIESSVFTNSQDESSIISQAIRVEQWQAAREYVRSVQRVLAQCDKFYQTDPDGKRVRIDIKEGHSDPPITDFVSRTFVASAGASVQTWSIMAVGDVLIGTRYLGPTGPQHSLMPDVENAILMRIAPQTFAPGGVEPDQTDDSGDTTTTFIEGGAADESPDAVSSTETSTVETTETTFLESGDAGD